MASNMAFNILVDVDGKLAAARVEELKAELEGLVGEDYKLKVGLSDAEFQVRVADIKAELREIAGSKDVEIHARADATEALAELEALKAKADEVNGKEVRIKAKVDGADESKSEINALWAAATGMGAAVIPIAASVTGALGAIGTGAVLGIAGAAALKMGLGGVSAAEQELTAAQQKNGATAATQAAQQISSANGIANAQDSLRNAIANVAVAQEAAAQSIYKAQEQVTTATIGVTQALQSEQSAEISLGDAQRAVTRDQQALTQARVDAKRALEDMAFSVTDNSLAQQRAALDVKAAQTALLSIAATDPRYAGAQLTLAESQQRLLELQTQGSRLTTDKATADAKGVDNSNQVVSAQDTLTQGLERVNAAQQAVTNGTVALGQAELREKDAIDGVTQARDAGIRSVDAAQQAVTSAQRALQTAEAQQAAQAASTAAANNQLLASYNQLSPAGKAFANFLHDDLQPKLKELQATAQAGMLPGIQAGLQAVMPMFPQIDGLIGTVSHSLGDMAKATGEGLNTPFWKSFISFINSEATPSFKILGDTLGNLAQGGAALLMDFKPVWDQMGAGVRGMSADFANWAKNLGQNSEFQKFLAYIRDNGPIVVSTFGNLFVAFSKAGEALGPLGHLTLELLNDFTGLLAILPQGTWDWLAPTILGITFAVKGLGLGLVITTGEAEGAAISIWGLNVALDANPIGLVILGLTALALGFQYAWDHSATFRNVVKDTWTVIKDVALFAWTYGIKPVFDEFVWAINLVGQAFGGVRDFIRDNWGQITDLAKAPIAFVVNVVYDQGILPVWNGIASVFGLHQLAPVQMATGGVVPGYGPGRDDVPAMLSKGEGVLVPEAVAGLGSGFVHWANRTFSNGRATGGPGFADGGIVGDLAGIITNPAGALNGLFQGVFDTAGRAPIGPSWLKDAIVAIPHAIVNSLIDKAKSLVAMVDSSGGGSGGAGVQQWAGMVTQALGIMHQDGGLLGTTLRRMNQESGGNPTAVNRSDINWQNGTPSVGLMQVIGPTYASNKVIDTGPYLYGVSVDPLANTLASMHYAIGRYGGLAPAYNQAGGYANGGLVTGPTIARMGEAGPEAIIPLNRPHQAKSLMSQAGIGGSTVHVGPVYVSSEVDIDSLSHRLAFNAAAGSL